MPCWWGRGVMETVLFLYCRHHPDLLQPCPSREGVHLPGKGGGAFIVFLKINLKQKIPKIRFVVFKKAHFRGDMWFFAPMKVSWIGSQKKMDQRWLWQQWWFLAGWLFTNHNPTQFLKIHFKNTNARAAKGFCEKACANSAYSLLMPLSIVQRRSREDRWKKKWSYIYLRFTNTKYSRMQPCFWKKIVPKTMVDLCEKKWPQKIIVVRSQINACMPKKCSHSWP